MPYAVGDVVGDFTFRTAEGADVALRDHLGKPLLLIFLRHLA